MNLNGFVKVHRKVIERGVNDDELGFLIRLIAVANWKGARFKGRKVKRGQLILSDRGMQSRLYPGDESPPAVNTIKRRLQRLQDTGTIHIETTLGHAGGRLVTISNYDMYQSLNASTIDAKVDAKVDANIDADRRRTKKNKNSTSSGRIAGTRSVKNRKPKPRKYAAEFEQWWSHYPRKVGKPSALKSFDPAIARIRSERQLSDSDAIAWLIGQTDKYARSVSDKAIEHVKHPAPWLNDDRFNDSEATVSTAITLRFDPKDAI